MCYKIKVLENYLSDYKKDKDGGCFVFYCYC